MGSLRSIKELWGQFSFILTSSQKKWGVVILIMTLLGAVFETLGVSIILPLVQVMIEPSKLWDNSIISYWANIFNINTNSGLIWVIGILVILIYIVKNIFLFLLSYIRMKYTCKVQRELSVEMMCSFMARGYTFFLNTSTGELMRGMQTSIQNTYQALYQIFKMIAEILTIFCICIFVMITDISMAMVVILLAISCLLIVVFVFRKWAKRSGEINHKYAALINKVLLQTFHGIKETLVMQKQQYFVDSYKKLYIKQQKGIIGYTVSAESPTYMIEGICVAGLIIAVCIKAGDAQSGAMIIPQLAAFAVAAFRILPSLGRISSSFNQCTFCLPGLKETYNNFQQVRGNEKRELLKEYHIDVNKDILEITTISDKLSLHNLHWRYPNVEEYVLDGINIDIHRGESIALVGSSGVGKTTLGDVILGLLHPQEGEVLIDGVNIHEIPKQWSHIIGFVPQNIYLMDDTLRKNVAYGMDDDDIDDNMVWRALEQAQMKGFVEELKEELNTTVGERGIRFSGGQRQRIAIARALYHNPDILVLDEATSALDTETEETVMDAIETLKGHKTLVIIAHRLTTIKNCDTIYKIEKGQAIKCKYEELN